MNRSLLDKELRELNDQVIQLGILVEEALAKVLLALQTSDQDKAGEVVVADTTIDDLHLAIEEYTTRILTLRQPLYGRDIRIAIDLERICDEAEGIAQRVLRMLPFRKQGERNPTVPEEGDKQSTEDSMIQKLLDLGKQVHFLLERPMKAFADRDAQAACSLWEEDRTIDQHHYVVQHDLVSRLEDSNAISALEHDPHLLQRAMHLQWITYDLERAADHCTNICERIAFIVEGETDIASLQED